MICLCHIRSAGELYLCSLIDVGLGNIKEIPIRDLFSLTRHLKFAEKLGLDKYLN